MGVNCEIFVINHWRKLNLGKDTMAIFAATIAGPDDDDDDDDSDFHLYCFDSSSSSLSFLWSVKVTAGGSCLSHLLITVHWSVTMLPRCFSMLSISPSAMQLQCFQTTGTVQSMKSSAQAIAQSMSVWLSGYLSSHILWCNFADIVLWIRNWSHITIPLLIGAELFKKA